MANDTSVIKPPLGFVLDTPKLPPLPSGFELDTPEELIMPPPVIPKPQIHPTTIQQRGMVPPSQYKRESILEIPTTGQKIANVTYEMGRGFVEEALLNIPKWPEPDVATEFQAPARGVGQFLGFIIGAPMKLGKMGTSLALKALKKPISKLGTKLLKKKSPYIGKIVERLGTEAFQLGLASALSEIEDVKGMPERFKSGAIFGSIFGGMRWANIQKMPVVSQMIRQVGTRALARTANLYQLPYENLDQWTSPEGVQRVFDELLFSWFSMKGAKPQEIFRDLQKIQKEIKGQKGVIPKVWERKGENVALPSGEVLPTKLFSGKVDIADVVKRAPKVEVPKIGVTKAPKKLIQIRIEQLKEQVKESKDVVMHGEAQRKIKALERQLEGKPEVVGKLSRLPIRESKMAKEVRERHERPEIVEINAKEFQRVFEKDQGNPLAWSESRLAILRKVKEFNAYPEVDVTKKGAVDVTDGRHRIALAAERGLNIQVAMDKNDFFRLPREVRAISKPTIKPVKDLVREARKPEARELPAKKALARIQKEQLLTQVDKALEKAPERGVKLPTKYLTFELPDGFTFKVFNDIPALESAKKQIKKWPITPLKPILAGKKLPSAKPLAPEKLKALLEPSYEEMKAWKEALSGKKGKGIEFGEFDEKYAGFPLFRALSQLDTHLEKKYGIRAEPALNRVENREIQQAVKKEVVELKEKAPIVGVRVREQLRRFGEPGNELADRTDRFQKNSSQGVQSDIYQFRAATSLAGLDIGKLKKVTTFEKTPKVIVRRLYDLLEAKRIPKSEAEKMSAKILEKIVQADKAQKAKEVGLKVSTPFGERDWQGLKHYAPVEYETKGFKQFMESKKFSHLRDWYVEKMAKEAEPYKSIYKIDKAKALEEAGKYFGEFREDLRTKQYGHLEKPRLLDEKAIEELRVRWEREYPKKPFPLKRKRTMDVLIRYLVGTNHRLEWIRQFGKDVKWGDRGYIPEKLLDTAMKFDKARSQKWTFDFFKKYLGRASAVDTRITKVIRTARTAQLGKLAFAFMPNSLQWFTNTLPIIPVRAIPKTLWEVAKFYGIAGKKAKKQAREFFSTTGAETLKQAVQLAMMEDPSKVNALASVFLKLHLFSGTEFNNALMAATAGKYKAIILSERLHKKGGKSWRSPFYKAELKKLGLSEADIEKIIKYGPLTAKDVVQLADAGFYMRRATQFLATAFDLPKTWSSPAGRLLTQFKNFAYNQTALLYTEGVKEAYNFVKSGGRQGDITKLMKFAIVLPAAGMAVTKFKEWLYPKFGLHFYEELMSGKSWPFKLAVFISNTGNLGIAMDALMAFRYGKAGMTNLILGPTISDVGNFFEAIGNTWKEIEVAFNNWNPKWLKQRSKTIRDYWLRFGERLSPDVKLAIQNFFSEYKYLKKASNWAQLVTRAKKEYKEKFMLKSPAKANEFWNAFMQTQGKEYRQIFGHYPERPTPKEVRRWWKEQGKSRGERVPLPGKKTTTNYEWWY